MKKMTIKGGSETTKIMKVAMVNVILLAVCLHHVESRACITPDGLQGRCLILNACRLLQAINYRPIAQVSLYDYTLLTQSRCEVQFRQPLFCCPHNWSKSIAMTPTGCYAGEQYGTCTRINSCPALTKKLSEPVNDGNLGLINSLRCKGHDPNQMYPTFGVCCPPIPFWEMDPRVHSDAPYDVENIAPNQQCSLTSLPPDPESECCGYQSTDDDRIIGGTATSIDQYPWLVLIEYEQISTKALDLLCGGSLISGRYVLTASHCVAGLVVTEYTPVNVRLGEYDISNPGPDCTYAPGGGEDCTDEPITIAIEEIIIHPFYDADDISRANDIALLRLTETAPYTYFIRPICLPTKDLTMNTWAEYKLHTSGWGFIENKHGIRSNIKLDVDLPYTSRSACQRLFSTINVTITDKQLCAGGEAGKDSCKGDSGGPLMHKVNRRYDVVGVVSFGPKPCGQQHVPSVYTNVYQYLPWIRDNMRP